MFFLSEERVLLPPQGEGWDGGGFISRVILLRALSELDTQLDLSQQLGLITETSRSEIDRLLTRIDKMLYALYRSKCVYSPQQPLNPASCRV